MQLLPRTSRPYNILLITHRLATEQIKFPLNGVVYRGGGLPDEHRSFFKLGREFRVAGFLASSFSQETAEHFMSSARARGEPCIMWEIHVDPAGESSPAKRCMHVSYVERSNMPGEKEYLFAPYLPFTVKQVRWGRGSASNPHIVVLEAGLDSLDFGEDLPLAPWL